MEEDKRWGAPPASEPLLPEPQRWLFVDLTPPPPDDDAQVLAEAAAFRALAPCAGGEGDEEDVWAFRPLEDIVHGIQPEVASLAAGAPPPPSPPGPPPGGVTAEGVWEGASGPGRSWRASAAGFWRRMEASARRDAASFDGDLVASAVWQFLSLLFVLDASKLQDAHGMLFSQRAFKESLRGGLYLVAALLLGETAVALRAAATGVAALKRRLVGYPVACVVPDASGIFPGAEVRFRGVRCGTVLGVTLRAEGAEVRFRLSDRHFRIPRSAAVRCDRQGMASRPIVNIDVPEGPAEEKRALDLNREEEARHRQLVEDDGIASSATAAEMTTHGKRRERKGSWSVGLLPLPPRAPPPPPSHLMAAPLQVPEAAAEAWDEFSQRLGLPMGAKRDPLLDRGGSVLPGEHLHGDTGTSLQGLIYLAVRLLRCSRSPHSAAARAFHETFRARLWGRGATHDLQERGRFALSDEDGGGETDGKGTMLLALLRPSTAAKAHAYGWPEEEEEESREWDGAPPTARQLRGRERGQQISAQLDHAVRTDRLALRALHVYVGSRARSEVPEYRAGPMLVRSSLRRVGAFRKNVLAPAVAAPSRRLAAAFRRSAAARPRFARFAFRAAGSSSSAPPPTRDGAP